MPVMRQVVHLQKGGSSLVRYTWHHQLQRQQRSSSSHSRRSRSRGKQQRLAAERGTHGKPPTGFMVSMPRGSLQAAS